ncbi:5-oxoprolinase subunit PxpB [Nakamurella sp. A5-74]|uniref:5-oxoprolinase subunit PxpB n=1 Tax=Nakamurella sp. A5-74 TaxID=3158264 RepID=A0AAU8DP73_9ACTN
MTDRSDRRTMVAGERAVLVELPDLEAALGLLRRLAALQRSPDAIAGVGEVVPAARTVLVHFDPALLSRAMLVELLDAVSAAPLGDEDAGQDQTLLEIPVVYDGEDLSEVAGLLRISPTELVRRHTGAEYTMAFVGFAPGFGYLVGGDPLLDVPRRASPRVRIPAGSVGLAGRFSGVYPRESPGGWQLIGTTTLSMWDVDREPPAALRPGDRVRFVVARGRVEVTPTAAGQRPAAPTHGPALIVERPGARTLLQDGGRDDVAALGVSGSGALDLPAMRLANRLVGNPGDTAVLEILFGRFRAVARGSVVVAATGAPVPIIVARADDRGTTEISDCRPIALQDGDLLTLGGPFSGARTMLAVRGGFDVAPVLGSLSRDTLAGLGPAPIARGDVLAVRSAAAARSGSAPEPVGWQEFPRDQITVPIDLGPRDDWFDDASIARLLGAPWTVTTSADRVGIRLAGAHPLARIDAAELPSECVVTGSIQVPPDGQPILFLADHPLTGGYPVIGVVRRAALAALAQVTPGMTIRFALAGPHPPLPDAPATARP